MNLNEAKVLMFDLDGTIVLNGNYIDQKVIDSLRKLKENGYILCVNSGRPYFFSSKLLESYDVLKLFDYLFGCNGSELVNIKKNEFHQLAYLEPDTIKEISSLFENEPIDISILTDEIIYINRMIDEENLKRYIKSRKLKPELIDLNEVDYNVSKLLGIIDDNGFERISSIVKRVDSDKFDLFFSSRDLLEIVAKGSNKGKACEIIKKMLGLTSEEIISFGDEDNDIVMFQNSIGVAMGNASAEVKKHARYITADINSEGISSFLKAYDFI